MTHSQVLDYYILVGIYFILIVTGNVVTKYIKAVYHANK
jgi:hypothetical protein